MFIIFSTHNVWITIFIHYHDSTDLYQTISWYIRIFPIAWYYGGNSILLSKYLNGLYHIWLVIFSGTNFCGTGQNLGFRNFRSYHENCESDIMYGKYDKHLAICIVMSAQVTMSKAIKEWYFSGIADWSWLASNLIAHSLCNL